ncbi:hypothetical protein [Methylacidimicrobium tartarophylax]|uniref:FecR protein domain-containing protein n=1 Tax=Methylacidimicrobium tartarophylax TaxID=1041768 RepID=A0A5E6MM36_9BACT|nr:hypothetical protein [Methylacidimicrobium tartarophylax]VVM06484.1 hypothetical protein MAMT_01225 [Methylacidimicrobium tartarophylax]
MNYRKEDSVGRLRSKKLSRFWTATSLAGTAAILMATAPLSPALWAASVAAASVGNVTGAGILAQNGIHLPLRSGNMPVANGARIETQDGSARVDLLSGGSLVLGPYGSMVLQKTGTGVVAKVESGIVHFRLPAGSRLAFESEKFHATSTGKELREGEILLGAYGNTAIYMTKGTLPVKDLASHKVTLATAGNPVDVGTGAVAKIKRTQAPAGLEEGDTTLPSGAKPIYGMNGQSLGYVPQEGGFAYQKGVVPPINKTFTTSDIPADANQPEGATAGFAKNGSYKGYLYKNVWYPYSRDKGGAGLPWWVWVATLAAVGAGVGAAAAFTTTPSTAVPVTSTSP